MMECMEEVLKETQKSIFEGEGDWPPMMGKSNSSWVAVSLALRMSLSSIKAMNSRDLETSMPRTSLGF